MVFDLQGVYIVMSQALEDFDEYSNIFSWTFSIITRWAPTSYRLKTPINSNGLTNGQPGL